MAETTELSPSGLADSVEPDSDTEQATPAVPWWRRSRLSTLILTVTFVGVFVLWVWVRPETPPQPYQGQLVPAVVVTTTTTTTTAKRSSTTTTRAPAPSAATSATGPRPTASTTVPAQSSSGSTTVPPNTSTTATGAASSTSQAGAP